MPKQYVVPPYDYEISVLDVSAEPDPLGAAEAWMRDDLRAPVAAVDAQLFAQAVFKIGPDRHLWYERGSHLIMDGRATLAFVTRVADIYVRLLVSTPAEEGALEPLAPLLAAERAYRDSADREDDGRTGAPPSPASPAGATAGAAAGVAGGGVRRGCRPRCSGTPSSSEPARPSEVKAAARRLRTHLPGLMIAAAAVYRHRATGERDVVIGLPVSGLPDRRKVFAPGMTSNVLPIRLRIDPDTTVADLVRTTNQTLREALRHQRYRYEDTLRDLRLVHGSYLCGIHVNVMAFGYPEMFGGCTVTGTNLSTGPIDNARIDVYDRPGEACYPARHRRQRRHQRAGRRAEIPGAS